MSTTKSEIMSKTTSPITTTSGLPQGRVDVKRWWTQKNLRTLNLWLLIPLLSIFAQGYAGLEHTIETHMTDGFAVLMVP